jgi:ribosomal protein L1
VSAVADKSAHNTLGQRRQEDDELIRNIEALVEKGDKAKAEDIPSYLKRTVTAL